MFVELKNLIYFFILIILKVINVQMDNKAILDNLNKLSLESRSEKQDSFNQISQQIALIGSNTERYSAIQFNQIQNSLNNIENNLYKQSNKNFEILQKQLLENYTKLQIESLKMHNELIREVVKNCNEIKKEIKKSEDNIKELLHIHEKENLKNKLLIAETKFNKY